jgi:serine/threonine protein kinase/tetratricopeptide (TPR) repeat protein
MATIAADRNLLFGLLALQNGLINQVQLVAAFQAWTLDKARALADHLVGRGDLEADDRSVVDALVARHVKKHGGKAEKSLAAISTGSSTRARLAELGDAQIDSSLVHLGAGSGATQHDCDPDPDRTDSCSVGTSTSDGQRFRVLRPHARGGLGTVFVALDGELHREVALKQILDHHADDPSSRARFLLEAEITGGLEHPGIVPVYGLGAHPDGRPYYVMRFIRGQSLKEAIANFHADDTLRGNPGRRSLGLLKLMRRFLAVCDAIDYAHSRGVLHRDLKPANVVLGKHGETLVVDWGLAKALVRTESDVASDERILAPSPACGSAETLPGSALGTPAYMSPEQAQGDLEHLGPRSDVYGLGGTLYYLLTGRQPFEGDDVGAVLRAVQNGDFPPPRRLDPAIDRALEAVCLKAMSLRPQDRYPTPRAMAEDIEHWMADEPVAAWREPWTRRARRWERRHRAAVMAGISAVLVALAGTFSVLVVQARANSDLIRSNNALAAANDRERARFALAMDAVKLFHGEVSEDFLLNEKPFGALRTRLLRGAAGFYSKLEGLLAGQTDWPSRTMLARAYDELAELTAKIGSKPDALAVRRKALAVYRALAAAPGADSRTKADFARSLAAVGWLQHQTGDTSGALASYEAARAVAGRTGATSGGDEQLQTAMGLVYQRMASALDDSGKPAQALAAYRQSIAIHQKLADAHSSVTLFQGELALSYSGLSGLEQRINKRAEALADGERALAIRQKLAGASPDITTLQSDLAHSHQNIGYLLKLRGKPTEALAAFERAIAIQEKLVKANPNVTYFQLILADSYNKIGWTLETDNPVEALVAIDRAIAILEKLTEADPSDVRLQSLLAFNLGQAGSLQLKTGRIADAVGAIRQSVAIYERLPTPKPADRYNSACAHAVLAGIAPKPHSGLTAEEGQAEAERAMQWLRRAVAAGYRNMAILRGDHNLDALRSRDDFQLLMMDLEFPDEPFAAAR